MRTHSLRIVVALAALLVAPWTSRTASAASEDLAGRWMVEKKDAIVLIEPQGDRLIGKIVWAKDRDGVRGEDRLDAKNPQPANRTRHVLGLPILTDVPVSPTNDGWHAKGRIYNPKTGKSYPVKMRLDSPNDLRLRVGGKVIGQTTHWTRVDGSAGSDATGARLD